MFIKIMVIFFLQKKTPYKSKHQAISFLQIFQTKILFSSGHHNQKKKRSGAKQTDLLVCFSRFTSNKICYKTWSKQPFCRKFNNIFRFSGYPNAQIFDFNRNNTYVIVHFCFCLVLLYSFVFFRKKIFHNKKKPLHFHYPATSMVHFLFISTRFILQNVQFFILLGSILYFIRLLSFIFGKFNDKSRSILVKN